MKQEVIQLPCHLEHIHCVPCYATWTTGDNTRKHQLGKAGTCTLCGTQPKCNKLKQGLFTGRQNLDKIEAYISKEAFTNNILGRSGLKQMQLNLELVLQMYQHLITTIEDSRVQLQDQVDDIIQQIKGSELNDFYRAKTMRHAINIKTKWREVCGARVEKELSEINEVFQQNNSQE